MSNISTEELEQKIEAGEEVIDRYFDSDTTRVGTLEQVFFIATFQTIPLAQFFVSQNISATPPLTRHRKGGNGIVASTRKA